MIQRMIAEEWPIVCTHSKCYGKANPATWRAWHREYGTRYLCTKHAERIDTPTMDWQFTRLDAPWNTTNTPVKEQ